MRICADSPAARRVFEIGLGLGTLAIVLGTFKRLGVVEWPRLKRLADTPTMALSSGGAAVFVGLRILARPEASSGKELENADLDEWIFPEDREKALHNGGDTRSLVQEPDHPRAKYVAALIDRSKLKLADTGDGWVIKSSVEKLKGKIVHGTPLGGQIRFSHLQTPCYGTGFLVAPDVLATAAHCICREKSNEIDFERLKRLVFIFNFQAPAEGQELRISESRIYHFRNVIYQKYIPPGTDISQDWALIQLNRRVSDTWLEINHHWEPKEHDGIEMLGHPLGLPLIRAGMATVEFQDQRDGDQSYYEFKSTLDALEGNSGSPIFGSDGRVAGILTRGPKKQWQGKTGPKGNRQYELYNTSDTSQLETGMVMSRLEFVQQFLPSIRAAPPAPDEYFKPGLTIEGECGDHGKRVVHLGVGNFNMNKQCWVTPCGKEIAPGKKCQKTMHGDTVNTMAVTGKCFASIRGRVSAEGAADGGAIAGLGIRIDEHLPPKQSIRFDVQKWRFIHLDIPQMFDVKTLKPGLTLRATALPSKGELIGDPIWFHIGEEGHFSIDSLKKGLEHHPRIRFDDDWACFAVNCWVWVKGKPEDDAGDYQTAKEFKPTEQPIELPKEVARPGMVLSLLLQGS